MTVGSSTEARQNEPRGALPPGTRLSNYELISVLGHGGFGITYFARDMTLGRQIAVKEYLPASLALREDGTMVVPRSTEVAEDFTWGRERFLEEARILATLERVPSIVPVHDFLEANGTAYMVMGLARGETLERRLKRDGPLPPQVTERLLEQLLDGLGAVHQAGFLHRDIKPANIILDASNNPTLIDFGAARAAMVDRTALMTAIYTPRYAAAEQLTSARQGPWTDIYSLSATLYHAITGRPPVSALERALNDTFEPLAERSPAGFRPNLLRGIDAGLALRAKDRPQSIADWRHIFSATVAAVDDATLLAPGPRTSVAGFGPPSASNFAAGGSRRVALYGGLAAVGVVLALSASGYWLMSTKLGPPAAPIQVEAQPKSPAIGSDQGRLELDLAASKIELIDGRYVLRGEMLNRGTASASATTLKLVFHKGDEVLSERTYPLNEGPVPPGGQLRFSRTLDNPPAGTTRLTATIEYRP
jgi:serine/threonine protein kinase